MLAGVLHDVEEGLGTLFAAQEENREGFESLRTRLDVTQDLANSALVQADKAVQSAARAKEEMIRDVSVLRTDTKESSRRAIGAESSLGAHGQELAGIHSELRALKTKMGSIEKQFSLFGANPTNEENQRPTPAAEASQSAATGWAATYEPPPQAQSRPPVSFVEDLHPQYDPARFARSAPKYLILI